MIIQGHDVWRWLRADRFRAAFGGPGAVPGSRQTADKRAGRQRSTCTAPISFSKAYAGKVSEDIRHVFEAALTTARAADRERESPPLALHGRPANARRLASRAGGKTGPPRQRTSSDARMGGRRTREERPGARRSEAGPRGPQRFRLPAPTSALLAGAMNTPQQPTKCHSVIGMSTTCRIGSRMVAYSRKTPSYKSGTF